MQVNSVCNVHFDARNPQIRFADDIARKVNKEYPRFSPSRMDCFNKKCDYIVGLENQWQNLFRMRDFVNRKLRLSKLPQKIEVLLNSVKMSKLGNCGEATDLTLISAHVNGIKNCKRARLETPYGGSFDHAVVLVEDKKPYIIDTWLGFADYVPNAIKRYQKDFRNCFDFRNKGEYMVVKETEFFLNDPIPDKILENIKQTHSEFLLCK